jgi:rhomboid protease GluP
MMRRDRIPRTTLVVLFITSSTTVLGLVYPGFVGVVQRTPSVYEGGEWWRLVSPVLVNPEGWPQIVSNGVTLAAVGTVAEFFWSVRAWLAFYLLGTVSGEIAGLAWRPVGAGSSVAVCGLLGAVAAALWHEVATIPARVGAAVIVAGAVLLAHWHDLHGPPLLLAALVGSITVRVAQWHKPRAVN